MLKNLSAKYYEETKERLQKKSKKSKIRKRKSDNMVVKVTEISERMKAC